MLNHPMCGKRTKGFVKKGGGRGGGVIIAHQPTVCKSAQDFAINSNIKVVWKNYFCYAKIKLFVKVTIK